MNGERHRQGMLDTNILILRPWIDPERRGSDQRHHPRGTVRRAPPSHRNDEQDQYDEHAERARRLEILQRAENKFDPVPFDAEAARLFGRVTAAVIAAGRTPRRRIADLMIAATAIAEGLPLYTTNPDDYAGLDSLPSHHGCHTAASPARTPQLNHRQPPRHADHLSGNSPGR